MKSGNHHSFTFSHSGESDRTKNSVHKGLLGQCRRVSNEGESHGRIEEAPGISRFPSEQEESGNTAALGERDQLRLEAGGCRVLGHLPVRACSYTESRSLMVLLFI